MRIGQAFYGTFFYLWKSIWPAGLIPLYEQEPTASPFDPENVAAACVFVGLTATCWRLRRRWPGLLVAWGAYLVLLLPVLGLAQSGPQLVADRYSYLSCLPWAVLVGGSAVGLWQTGGQRRKTTQSAMVVCAVVIVAVLVFLTKSQVSVWADSRTLWTTVLEKAPHTGTAHANLASLLNRQGDYEGARQHSLEALAILPGNRTAHIALARASTELGDFTTAEKHFGIALMIRPNDVARMLDLALVKYRHGKTAEAEELYRDMIDLRPKSAIVHYNLGSFLASQDRRHEAKLSLEKAVQLDPLMSEAWFRLAVVRWRVGEPAAAIGVLETGLFYAPEDPLLAAKLAWMLATCPMADLRDGPRAVELARQAMHNAAGADLPAREALAAALAEVGDFPGAVSILDEVLEDVSRAMGTATRERLKSQLDRYRNRTPIRDPDGAGH